MPVTVLFVSTVGILGGAERSLLELVLALDPRRTRAVLAAPRGPLAEAAAAAGIAVHTLAPWRPHRTQHPLALARLALQAAARARTVAAIARAERAALLHANGLAAHLVAAAATRRCGRPCVWHARDLADPPALLTRWLARRAAAVVAISDAVAERLVARLPPGTRIERIANGIDLERFAHPPDRIAARAALGVPPEAFLCGMAAQLVPWKRHDRFLAVATAMAARRPEAYFSIAGADSFGEHPELARSVSSALRRPPLAGRAQGPLEVADMPGWYAALDALVHPAAEEPFGRVIVEAMAAGRCVVAADSAGPHELIRSGVEGWLLPPAAPDEWVACLDRLAGDPSLRARIGAAARTRAASAFDVRRVAEQVQSLHARILNTP